MIQSIRRLAKKQDLPRNLALGVIAGSLLAKTSLEPPSPLLTPQDTETANFPIMSLAPPLSDEDHPPEHSFYAEEKNLSAYGTSGSLSGTGAGSTNWMPRIHGKNWGFLDSWETSPIEPSRSARAGKAIQRMLKGLERNGDDPHHRPRWPGGGPGSSRRRRPSRPKPSRWRLSWQATRRRGLR